MKNYLYIGLVGGAMLLARCGALENKADNVLGLDETTMSECVKDLAACAKLAERAQSLSLSDMLAVDRVSSAVLAKLKSEWVPQLEEKAKQQGVKSFSIDFKEDGEGGVLLLPQDGKFKGFVSGTAHADSDETDFIFRLEATVSDGAVDWELKR